MTQRLSMKSDAELDGLAKEILESSNQFMGRTSNLTRTLLTHSPMLARWFLGLVASVRQPNLGATTDVRLRNLATIKTSMTNECKYCTSHTSIFGQSMGLTDEQLAAMRDDAYKTSPLFDERERAVIAWAEAMTLNKAARDEAAWSKMRELFSEKEIVEISLASSMFDMINRLNDSLWTNWSRWSSTACRAMPSRAAPSPSLRTMRAALPPPDSATASATRPTPPPPNNLGTGTARLKRFRAKWTPVRVKKTRQNKKQ